MSLDHKLSEDEQHQADEDRLKWVIKWSVTFCVGGMAGFIASIRQVNPTIVFRFDWLTALALIVGCGMGWLFWRVIPGDDDQRKSGRSKWLPLGLWVAALCGMMLAGFAYGMKDISGEKQREMYIGTGMAFLVLAFVGFLFWRSVKYFEDDHRRYLEEHHQKDE
jgi:hypothetical protein